VFFFTKKIGKNLCILVATGKFGQSSGYGVPDWSWWQTDLGRV